MVSFPVKISTHSLTDIRVGFSTWLSISYHESVQCLIPQVYNPILFHWSFFIPDRFSHLSKGQSLILCCVSGPVKVYNNQRYGDISRIPGIVSFFKEGFGKIKAKEEDKLNLGARKVSASVLPRLGFWRDLGEWTWCWRVKSQTIAISLTLAWSLPRRHLAFWKRAAKGTAFPIGAKPCRTMVEYERFMSHIQLVQPERDSNTSGSMELCVLSSDIAALDFAQ